VAELSPSSPVAVAVSVFFPSLFLSPSPSRFRFPVAVDRVSRVDRVDRVDRASRDPASKDRARKGPAVAATFPKGPRKRVAVVLPSLDDSPFSGIVYR
jgi:hypothetical protein